MPAEVSRFAFEDLRIGQEAGFEVEVSERDIDRFAALSGDVSPLHVDAGFALSRGFDGRVAHGALLTALVSRLVGVHLPGENCLLQSLNMQFRRPVLAGTRVLVSGVVEQLSEAVRTVVIRVTVRDGGTGETAATGKATVGLTRPVTDA